MPDRCKAFFNGLEVQVSCSMTRSPGTSPDIGQIVFRRGAPLPASFIGDLVLMNGSTEVVRFTDCILMSPSERVGKTRDIVYKIADRRWRWKTPRLFGQYNVRDEANILIDGFQKNARQLALLALEALHAPDGGTFDVSALPEDPELAPTVNWSYEPASVVLDQLCALFACTVHLLNDNTVKIFAENDGPEPDDVGLMHPFESGLIINPVPSHVTAYAGDTWFDGWLVTEDIGMELGGEIRPIEMLSYAPVNGWRVGDPKRGYDSQIRGKLRGTMQDEQIDKIIELANRNLFRMRRIVGFPAGQSFFPGFVTEATTGSLPGTGDPSKIYSVSTTLGTRTAIWNGSQFVGVTYTNASSSCALVDPTLIANMSADPVVYASLNRVDCEDWRKSNGNARLVICLPGVTVVDPRLLLPLLPTRVEVATDENGQRSRRKAEVCGVFYEDDYKLRNKTTEKLGLWKHGVRIDTNKGHIILGAPAYVRGSGGVEQAFMFLRCGYGMRLAPYGSRYHRQYNLSTGSTLNIANDVVNRTDVNELIVMNYASDYNDLSQFVDPIRNTAAIDEILQQSATEFLKQYQGLPAPKRKMYTPFRAIDTNGKTLQISYECGHGQFGVTTASVGGAYNVTQPPAVKKRLQQLQQRRAEFALQDFRAQQAIIENGNGASNVRDIA